VDLKFHKSILISILFFFFGLSLVQAQITDLNIYTIKGKIIDAAKKIAVAYCNIGINGKAIGTLSNENGNFQFKIKKVHLQDTLYLNALGYKPKLLPVNGIFLGKGQTFEIEPSAIQIDEVTISAIPTMKIIDRALNNIKNNYPVSSYVSDGFYREYITEDGACRRLIEASVKILEKGYTDKRSVKLKQTVNIDEIKQTHDYRDLRTYNWDGLKYLMNENIRGINPGGVINTYPLKDWIFTSDEITLVNGEQAHVVKFKPAEAGLPRPEGTLYISTKDYAIIQLDYSIKSGLEKWHNSKISDSTRIKYHDWNITFAYKRFDKKLYLNYMTHNRNFKVKHTYLDESYMDVSINNELFINNIIKKNIITSIQEQAGDYNYLLRRNLPFNKKYWETFNLPPPSARLQKMYDEINFISKNKRLTIINFLKEREKYAPR